MADLYCDICGRQPVRAQILLEGAKMLACGACMRSGKIIFRFEDDEEAANVASETHIAKPSFDTGEEVVEDYAKIIRNSIDKLRLPLAVIAERINEKESYLHAIEGGRMNPSLEVARKLEKELSIKLIERGSDEVTTSVVSGGRFSEPTLGDLLSAAKNKKAK